jgi:hypothetical protein
MPQQHATTVPAYARTAGEGRNEGRGRVIAADQRHLGHALQLLQLRQGRQQACALAPLAKAHLGLSLEPAAQRALGHAQFLAPLRQLQRGIGYVQQVAAPGTQTFVLRPGQAQRGLGAAWIWSSSTCTRRPSAPPRHIPRAGWQSGGSSRAAAATPPAPGTPPRSCSAWSQCTGCEFRCAALTTLCTSCCGIRMAHCGGAMNRPWCVCTCSTPWLA